MENKFQKMLEQASDLAEDQEYEEAMLVYAKVLNSDPKNIPALLDKAATLQRMGKNSQSFQVYNSVFKGRFKKFGCINWKRNLASC